MDGETCFSFGYMLVFLTHKQWAGTDKGVWQWIRGRRHINLKHMETMLGIEGYLFAMMDIYFSQLLSFEKNLL